MCHAKDRSSLTIYINGSSRTLHDIVEIYILFNVGRRDATQSALLFTHFQGESRARLVRIHLLLSLLHRVSNYIVKLVYFSYHCLVTVAIGKRDRRKPGFNWSLWKLNGKPLEDKTFNDTMKTLVSEIELTLEAFGKVQEIAREKWNVGGFIGIESTTRTVRMTLKEGVTVVGLPHELCLFYGNVLVVAPGRPPM